VSDLKKQEVESRKLANQEDDLQRKAKSKKDQLIEFQTSSGNRERIIATSKQMVA